MRYSTKFLLLAIDLIIGVSLGVTVMLIYNRVSDTAAEQQNTLASLQSEYENSDALLLDGETVSAAKAISVARQYSKKLQLFKNGHLISAGATLSRHLFKENTQWILEVRTTENGNAYGINFRDTSLSNDDPADLNEAKAAIAALLGSNSNESWRDLFHRIEDLNQNDAYRVKIANLVGADIKSSWSDVYNYVDKALSTYEGSTVNASEQFTIPVNGSATWTMDSPTFCYLSGYNSYGVIVFTDSGAQVMGDYDADFVQVDVTNKTIKIENVQWVTECVMIRR